MSLFANLDRPDPAGCLVRPAPRRVALLTGQSAPRNTALSPEQVAFLARVAPAGFATLAHGFPFHAACERAPYRRPSLALASLNNARQFIAATRDAHFRAVLEARIGELLRQTSERLVVVTGSCGLELLNAAWTGLPASTASVQVVAVGPACLGRLSIPAGRLTTVRGARDGWSRLLYRGPVDHEVGCGHLDYWTSPDVILLVRRLIARFAEAPP